LSESTASLRILLVTEPSGGGSGRHVIDLARELTVLGHEVAVVYSPTRAEPMFVRELRSLAFFAVEALPMRRAVGPWDVGAALALRRIIDRLGPFDVIHGHSSKAGALARLVAPPGAARVYTPHAFRTMDPTTGRLSRLVYGGVEALLGRLVSDAVIAVSPEEAEHARALGIPESKVHTVINGLTPAPVVDREAARAALGLKPADIAAGFVGRLCAQKDPVRFAEAIRLAHARDPRIRGVVLGDGELKAETLAAGGEALTVHSGLNAREYLPAFDLFVMTSRYEAMPYVLLEALQAGLPIVSTKVGGTSVAVADGENGVLLDLDASPGGIAEVIIAQAPADRRAAFSAVSRAKGAGLTASDMAGATVAACRQAIRA
jgi:glycosyltransferase involved in cell wall biosynthesis